MGKWADLWEEIKDIFVPTTRGMEKHFEAGVKKAREPIIKGHYEAPTGAIPSREKLDYFMATGFDFRGQVNTAYETLGMGASANLKVDIAQVFLPGSPLTASLGGSLAAKRAPYRFMVLEFQGNSLEDFDGFRGHPEYTRWAPDDQHRGLPVCLSRMTGAWTSMKVGIEAEAGIKASNMVPLVDVESISLGFEAKITGYAGAGYEGTYISTCDLEPHWYERGKANIEKDVVGFIAKEKRVLAGNGGMDFNPYCSLRLWTHTGDAKAGISASASVSAGKSEEGYGPGAKWGATLQLPEIKGMLKCTLYRVQTPTAAGIICTQDTVITYKQVGGTLIGITAEIELGLAETAKDEAGEISRGFVSPKEMGEGQLKKVTGGVVSSVDLEPASKISGLPLKIAKTAFTKGGSEDEDEDEEGISLEFDPLESLSLKLKGKMEKKFEVLNSMSYRTAVAYWTRTDKKFWPGSGLIQGQSVCPQNLIRYYSNRDLLQSRFESARGYKEPSPEQVNEMKQRAISILLANSVRLPTVEMFIAESYIAGWNHPRRKIKDVDNALGAYLKRCNQKPWQGPAATVEPALRTLCPTDEALFKTLIDECRIRTDLLADIYRNIIEWQQTHARDNPRAKAVMRLRNKCRLEFLRLRGDVFVLLNTIYEFRSMKTYLENLAKALHVSVPDLRAFLDAAQDNFEWTMTTPGVRPSAFLIEAAFGLGDLKPMQGKGAVRGNGEIGDCIDEFERRVGPGGKKQPYLNLQCLRLRYRIADTENKDHTLFKLGIDVKMVKLGFSLERVYRVGNEGVFDVYIHWYGPYSDYNSFVAGRGLYPPKAMPAANLLT
ncbi:MAG: hypothetical protein MUC41_01900 [Syntrophobacteraceae bacterium]|jgi:hypothetical protein|nr:hypothetical protein [Syntrophobacteraceae bacterium]